MHLETGDTKDYLYAGFSESMSHLDIGMLIEPRRQLHNSRNTLSVMQSVNQCLGNTRIISGPIQTDFDRRNAGVQCRRFQHIHDVIEGVVREVKQHISCPNYIKNTGRVVNLWNVDRRVRPILQCLAARIGEGQKILGVVVATSRNHAVIPTETKTFTQGIE